MIIIDINDIYCLTEPAQAPDGAGPVQHQGSGPGACGATCTCRSGEGLQEGE